jgi:hypothetical protein
VTANPLSGGRRRLGARPHLELDRVRAGPAALQWRLGAPLRILVGSVERMKRPRGWAASAVWSRRHGASDAPVATPLSRAQDRRRSRIRAGRSRLQGELWGRRHDDAGVFQGVLDARCMGPRDANWR